ncbi:MAG TPA: Omp28-related outer membrane protein [Bacteroidia bacterium]|jgi:hypothetical protein|nr:Omp28-related outer membrane protein [Bacteroidia bacterium]
MKKITMILTLLISSTAFAQTQRTVLVEEFTQASCGPCAQANPSFNKTLDANISKAVSIKYQTSWPGTDPMNAQAKDDVAKRVTYYKVSGVPDASMDGASTVSPSQITTTAITKEYGVASSFTLGVTQQLNSAQDSIAIEISIGAAKDFTTAGPFYLRVALVEKTIIFAKAPGSNGEKEFYNVMRKMYPNPTGTSLAVTWKNGESKKVNFKVAVPSYIYKKDQLAVVAFLQTDNDKVVQQAAKSGSTITGIDDAPEQAANANVFVFPNPMTDAATVGIQVLESNMVSLQVVNALGQIVIQNNLGQLNAGEQWVDLNTSSLKPGLYFLNVYVGEQLITKKIAIND